jgi:excinuclease ABC subunit B
MSAGDSDGVLDETAPPAIYDIAALEKQMLAAAADLDFELAASLRDEIKRQQALNLGLPAAPKPQVNKQQKRQRKQ